MTDLQPSLIDFIQQRYPHFYTFFSIKYNHILLNYILKRLSKSNLEYYLSIDIRYCHEIAKKFNNIRGLSIRVPLSINFYCVKQFKLGRKSLHRTFFKEPCRKTIR